MNIANHVECIALRGPRAQGHRVRGAGHQLRRARRLRRRPRRSAQGERRAARRPRRAVPAEYPGLHARLPRRAEGRRYRGVDQLDVQVGRGEVHPQRFRRQDRVHHGRTPAQRSAQPVPDGAKDGDLRRPGCRRNHTRRLARRGHDRLSQRKYAPRRSGRPALLLRHHRLSQGRDAHPQQHHQQRAHHGEVLRLQGRGQAGGVPAAVPRVRAEFHHERRLRGGRDAGAVPPLRTGRGARRQSSASA